MAILIGLIISLALNAQTTYYVATAANGGSNSNNGTIGSPWLTVAYAAGQATTAGDIINVGTGSFTENIQIVLSVGVSLEGDGTGNTNIYTSLNGGWEAEALISASSGSITDGNQHISGIAFNGNNYDGFSCIYVSGRNNVEIHSCTFDNFFKSAVTYSGRVSGSGEPSVWCTGNKFHDNTINDCSRLFFESGDWYSGCLQIGVQEGMEIYNNNITQNTRGTNQNGYCIKYWDDGYNRGLKIYKNHLIKAPSTTFYNDWDFAIELWNYRGGIEIYDNRIEGGIDIDHVEKGIYDFGLKIYKNVFGYDDLPPSSGNWTTLTTAFFIEFSCSDIYIFENEIKNMEGVIGYSPRSGNTFNNIQFYYNLIHDIGNTSNDVGCRVLFFNGSNFLHDSLIIRNNTIYAGGHGAGYGLVLPDENFTNVRIENNIIQGFLLEAITLNANHTNSLWIQNNDFYATGTNIAITGTPSNYTNSGNLTSIPNFASAGTDFTLNSSSANRDAALDFGYTHDFRGYTVPFNSIPDIGAFEYGALPTGLFTVKGNTGFSNMGQIYPNPSTGIVYVKTSNKSQIVVRDISGHMIYCQDSVSEFTKLDYTFRKGVYIVQFINCNSDMYSTKLIVW